MGERLVAGGWGIWGVPGREAALSAHGDSRDSSSPSPWSLQPKGGWNWPPAPCLCPYTDRTRPDLLSEDLQRQFVQEVVQSQQATVSQLLEDFRSKRLMGMTPWEHDLTQLEAWVGRDRASFEARERHLAERLLTHLEEMQ